MLSEKEAHALCVHIVRLLREERQKQGLTKYALAARSGISEQMIGYVESGARIPSLKTSLRLAAGLDIDFSALVAKALCGRKSSK